MICRTVTERRGTLRELADESSLGERSSTGSEGEAVIQSSILEMIG